MAVCNSSPTSTPPPAVSINVALPKSSSRSASYKIEYSVFIIYNCSSNISIMVNIIKLPLRILQFNIYFLCTIYSPDNRHQKFKFSVPYKINLLGFTKSPNNDLYFFHILIISVLFAGTTKVFHLFLLSPFIFYKNTVQ